MKTYLNSKIEYNEKLLVDLFRRYKFLEKFKDNLAFYLVHDVIDGENPENISYKYYGTQDYWWIILLFNEIYDPFFGWILTVPQVEEYARLLTIEQFGTVEGHEDYYSNLITVLHDENSDRRTIKILRPEYLSVVIKQLKS